MLTQERLKELLHYDAETGIFTWINSSRPGWNGKSAGFIHNPEDKTGGYVVIVIDGKNHRAHRLAWLYMNGKFPADGIDHKNRIRHDNRISNLRESDQAENTSNTAMFSSNTSGVKGVTWHKDNSKWTAQITTNGKRHYLGSYQHKADAEAAVRAKREELHGAFANHG